MRYSDIELIKLLSGNESDLVELKANFSGDVAKKARQAVCAFANDLSDHRKPGVLFVGVDDSGNPTGLPITDQLLKSLSDIKTDGNILPLPALTVESRAINGVDVAVVTVFPSDMPPVKYEGRIWVRTGPRRSIANEQEERILIEKRRYKNIPFDIHPIENALLGDLSQVQFETEYLPLAFSPDVLEQNGRSYSERLASCKMILSPERPLPTVVGTLAFSLKAQEFLPGSFIQFLKLSGIALTDEVVDSAEIKGTIIDQIRRMDAKFESHNRVSVSVLGSSTHTKKYLYPPDAFRQILYNAVMHRTYEKTNTPIRVYWYDDRIEIISPGGPYGNVTVANFGRPGVTDYRNPNIAELLKVYGFVQSFGRGIALAESELLKNGNPPIEFDISDLFVKVILKKHPELTP